MKAIINGKIVLPSGVIEDMALVYDEKIIGIAELDGIGDMETIDAKEAEELARKMQKASFDLEDFRTQMRRIKKLGSLDSILKMIPGLGGLREGDAGTG